MHTNSLKRILWYWVPAVGWITLIFYLSSRPKVPVSESYWLSFIFFKTLHILEYAALFFLFFRGLHGTAKHVSFKQQLLLAFALAVLYGLTDEIHQTFVPTREGRIRDVFIDTLGISIMYIYIKKYKKRLPKIFL